MFKMISPNPARALVINGPITLDLIGSMLLDIHRLKAESPEPITFYIQSPGGTLDATEQLMALMRSGENPCEVVCVGTTQVASAAALILSLGDYAWAYPNCSLLYHGPRQNSREVTREAAAFMGKNLGSVAHQMARTLALKMFPRILRLMRTYNQQVLKLQEVIEQSNEGIGALARQLQSNCASAILPCWAVFLEKNLSRNGQRLIFEALQTALTNFALLRHASMFDTEVLDPVLRKIFLMDSVQMAAESLRQEGGLEGLGENETHQQIAKKAYENFGLFNFWAMRRRFRNA